MKKLTEAHDVDGRILGKGDMVATLNDNTSAKICDICTDLETTFVFIKSAHQPYGKGVWHAADQVQRISVARKPINNKR